MIELSGIPVIETERLRLRGPQTSDFEVFAAYNTTPRSQFTGGPVTRAMAWRGFCHITGHWLHRGYSAFIITDKATDTCLGMSGPWFPEGWPEPEISWSLWAPQAEGQGFAHEAALATRAYAYATLSWKTAISLIDPANARSQALAQRMGCTRDGSFVHEVYGDSQIWRHPSPEALA